MSRFDQCSDGQKSATEREKCKEQVAFKQGQQFGEQVPDASISQQSAVEEFVRELSSETHWYRLQQEFYRGMRSKSDRVHIQDKNGELDVYIDYNVGAKVQRAVGVIRQQMDNRETAPEKARQSALLLANADLSTLNTEEKPGRGKDPDEVNRENRNRAYEREDFVRLFNEHGVNGFKAVLERGKVRIISDK